MDVNYTYCIQTEHPLLFVGPWGKHCNAEGWGAVSPQICLPSMLVTTPCALCPATVSLLAVHAYSRSSCVWRR